MIHTPKKNDAAVKNISNFMVVGSCSLFTTNEKKMHPHELKKKFGTSISSNFFHMTIVAVNFKMIVSCVQYNFKILLPVTKCKSEHSFD